MWRFNNSLLEDGAFCKKMEEWIEDLILHNIILSSDIAPIILWDAAKAILRGHIISYSSFKNRQRKLTTMNLKEELLYREALHEDIQSEENWKNLMKARADFNLDQSNYIKQKSLYLKQKIHVFRNKSGK